MQWQESFTFILGHFPTVLTYSFAQGAVFTYYVSQNQGFLDPPSPLRQQWSAFARRPFCTTIFYVDLFT